MTQTLETQKTLKPLGYRILVKRMEVAKMQHGLILPDSAQQKKSSRATVVALGSPKILSNGTKIDFPVKVGQIVLLDKYGGNEVTIDDQEMTIVKVEDIMGVIEN